MTKYEKISKQIETKILNGEYEKNTALPFEYELCSEYNCSKQTMKKALEILVLKGLIYRQRGKGTFVKSNFNLDFNDRNDYMHKNYYKFNMTGEQQSVTQEKDLDTIHKTNTNVLEFKVINPSIEISKILNVSQESFVYYFVRNRFIDGEPSSVITSYVPIDLVPGLTKSSLESSFFSYIEDTLNLKIKSIHKKITVSPSDSITQQYLQLTESEPIAVIEGIHFLSTGEIFEYSISKNSYKDFVFTSIHTNK